MEPGLRDREYRADLGYLFQAEVLQWSPVLETGNTCSTQNPLLATSLAGLRERCQPALGQGAAGAPAGGGKHGSD